MTHETNEPEKNDQRATQGLDPAPVDEPCRVVVVPLASGQSVTVSMRSVAPLTGEEEAALGEIVRAAAARMEREHPHAGVITALMQASLRSRVVLRAAGEGDLADRLGVAIRSAADVIRAAGADRDSRFRWAEEAARLEAELDAERLAHAGTQGERDAGDDFAKGVREWLDVPDEPGWGLVVRDRIAELARVRSELAELRDATIVLPPDWVVQIEHLDLDNHPTPDQAVIDTLISWEPKETDRA